MKVIKSNLCTVSLDSCTVVTSQIVAECHLRGLHTKITETCKNHSSLNIFGLSKFAQTFSVMFVKHFPFNQSAKMLEDSFPLISLNIRRNAHLFMY